MREKINVCILINEKRVPSWVYSVIDKLAKSGHADISLVISKPPDNREQRYRRNLPAIFVLKVLEKADYFLFRIKNNYNYRRDISGLENITGLHEAASAAGDSGGTVGTLSGILDKIGPDLIVQFGQHNPVIIQTHIPALGVWKFSVDAGRADDGLDYGLREVIRNIPVTTSSVEMMKDNPGQSDTIFFSKESTCPFSITRNRNKVFYRATLFLPRLVEGVRLYGEEYLLKQKERFAENRSLSPEMSGAVTLGGVLRDVGKYLIRVSGLVMNKVLYTDAFSWKIMIDISNEEKSLPDSFSNYTTIRSPRGLFWADPFVVGENGRYYIFVEEFIYRKNKAHISFLELSNQGELLRHQKVIENSYHLSYPFIFKEGEFYYMIPESSANRSIELYRCTGFPDRWEFVAHIMREVSATDTTLFFHSGKWWLFTTLDQTGSVSGGSTELFLFYSDNPITGRWKSHPQNPIVSDESCARCAGRLFVHEGTVYRPAQDCSVRYGRGFSLRRVTRMDELEYNEITEHEIKPVWNKKLKGTHTFNSDNGLTVIDTYTFHSRL
jgi:hypothetical protein